MGKIIELKRPTNTNVAPIILVYTGLYPNPSIKKFIIAPKHMTEPFMMAKIKNIILKFLFLANSNMSDHNLGISNWLSFRASSYALADGNTVGLYLNNKIIGKHMTVAKHETNHMKY